MKTIRIREAHLATIDDAGFHHDTPPRIGQRCCVVATGRTGRRYLSSPLPSRMLGLELVRKATRDGIQPTIGAVSFALVKGE
jgi:hypothetical protein